MTKKQPLKALFSIKKIKLLRFFEKNLVNSKSSRNFALANDRSRYRFKLI